MASPINRSYASISSPRSMSRRRARSRLRPFFPPAPWRGLRSPPPSGRDQAGSAHSCVARPASQQTRSGEAASKVTKTSVAVTGKDFPARIKTARPPSARNRVRSGERRTFPPENRGPPRPPLGGSAKLSAYQSALSERLHALEDLDPLVTQGFAGSADGWFHCEIRHHLQEMV